MARTRRTVRPCALVHILVRFLNHERLLDSADERADYLRRASRAFGASDWRVLAFVLMGTHTHFAAIAGLVPFGTISRSIHAGFAGWLNPRRGRLGPVVAGRPATYEIDANGAARLIAYLHNNPVAAGIVTTAAGSDWSSHAYYIGAAIPPPWLHVDEGLSLAGFEPSPKGMRGFDRMVAAAAEQPRPDFCVGSADLAAALRAARDIVGASGELGSPNLDAGGKFASASVWSLVSPERSGIDIASALEHIARTESVPLPVVRSKSRRRDVVRVRKIAVICLHSYLGTPLHVVAANLGITAQAAHQLEASATREHQATARRVADRILKT